MLKSLSVLAALSFLAVPSHADFKPDYIIQVDGGFTAQGETFSVSYQADVSGNHAPYGLVPGTLNFSSSGLLGTFDASPFNVNYPEGGLWVDSSGFQISLQLFRTPGCGTTPDNPCQPAIGPNEAFLPGLTDADLNAFASGVFELIPPGQSFAPGMFGDVQVSFVPEPSTLLALATGLAAIAFRLTARRERE